jgi:hypothetical protein
VIVEILPRQDVYETQPVAAHVIAIARLLEEPSKSKASS